MVGSAEREKPADQHSKQGEVTSAADLTKGPTRDVQMILSDWVSYCTRDGRSNDKPQSPGTGKH